MNSRRTVAVTGANGFVGRAVCQQLLDDGWEVRACVRSRDRAELLPSGCRVRVIPDYADADAVMDGFRGTHSVVHLVARTHCLGSGSSQSLEAYRACNLLLSEIVADCAAKSRTQRLVFMSSIKAVGEGSEQAYTECSECRPEDAYGRSKLEAERALEKRLKDSDTKLTVLRPPLVYGSEARGNLALLLRAIEARLPLPLLQIRNRRSMVHVRSLAEAVRLSVADQSSHNRLFNVADPQPRSTVDLVRCMAMGLNVRPILWPVPQRVLRLAAAVTGRQEATRRLTESLTVDAGQITSELGWAPVVDWEQGIREMASAYAVRRRDQCERSGSSIRAAA